MGTLCPAHGTAPIRLLIVENDAAFRRELAEVLEAEPDFAVCGQTARPATALQCVRRLKPQLVVVGVSSPFERRLSFIQRLRAANKQLKLLIVSRHDKAAYADRVLRAGGDGYVLRGPDLEEVLMAVRDVLAGHIYVSEAVFDVRREGGSAAGPPPCRPLEQLTASEREILELLGSGKSHVQIARRLQRSVKSVTATCHKMRRALRLKSVPQLVGYAVRWREENTT